MKHVQILGGLGAVCLMVTAPAAQAQCRGPDSTSTAMIRNWKSLMGDGWLQAALFLGRYGVPHADTSQVVLVTDRTACTKAMKAYNAAAALSPGAKPPSGAVYVIRVGTVYVVRDPVHSDGGWPLDMVLTDKFGVRGQILG